MISHSNSKIASLTTMDCGSRPVSFGNRRCLAEGSESLAAISVFLTYLVPMWSGGKCCDEKLFQKLWETA